MLRVAMSTAAQAPPKDSDTVTMYTEFGWTDFQQGLALSSFYVGYTILQVPGAMLAASRVGPCRTVLIGIAGAGLFTLLTPLAADHGLGGVVVVRDSVLASNVAKTCTGHQSRHSSQRVPTFQDKVLTFQDRVLTLKVITQNAVQVYS